jgi:hypothetical protein
MGPHISDRRHAAEHAIQLSSILAQIRQRASRNTRATHDDGSSATAKQYDCIGNDDAAATCSRDRNASSLTRLNRDVEPLRDLTALRVMRREACLTLVLVFMLPDPCLHSCSNSPH